MFQLVYRRLPSGFSFTAFIPLKYKVQEQNQGDK